MNHASKTVARLPLSEGSNTQGHDPKSVMDDQVDLASLSPEPSAILAALTQSEVGRLLVTSLLFSDWPEESKTKLIIVIDEVSGIVNEDPEP